jgi:hypothetical protein
MLHTMRVLIPAVALFAIAALPTLAGAQGKSRDGGPSEGRSARIAVNATCSTVTLRKLRSQNTPATTHSTTFTTIPGATATVTMGGTSCITVLFTAETGCGTSGADDICYLRALVDGVALHPADSFRAVDSEHFFAGARAYEWFRVVGTGTHTIVVQAKVGSSATEFYVDDWSLDVEVSNSP